MLHLLTLSKTTNFRLFQTQRVCRWQFRIWWKWGKVLQNWGKHCGKRRNCSLRAISTFPTVFSKDLYCRHIKTRTCLERVNSLPYNKIVELSESKASFCRWQLTLSQTIPSSHCPIIENFWKYCGKNNKLLALSNWMSLSSTILNLMKMAETSHKR